MPHPTHVVRSRSNGRVPSSSIRCPLQSTEAANTCAPPGGWSLAPYQRQRRFVVRRPQRPSHRAPRSRASTSRGGVQYWRRLPLGIQSGEIESPGVERGLGDVATGDEQRPRVRDGRSELPCRGQARPADQYPHGCRGDRGYGSVDEAESSAIGGGRREDETRTGPGFYTPEG